MDNGYTRGRSCVRRSAAYGIQQRWVAVLTGRLHRHEISIHHFLSAVAYHTPALACLFLFILYTIYLLNSHALIAKSSNISVLLSTTGVKK
ncbi:hypothetical protein T11_3308 [Trichinella zimbabwensis]|uniref:Uncharacterized protein n=1 Tax=Trichinella zimbabwensis TaxID=268475 RepID=A0A0V1HRS1_9BILA|nr:hypothetical protein T11_3308 [Trichinella zimbabwensis]